MSETPRISAPDDSRHGAGERSGAGASLPTTTAFQVVTAGLTARDQRLVKVLMRHDPDATRRFELASPTAAMPPVILLANPFETEGVRAIAAARSQPGIMATVHVLPESARGHARFTIEAQRLSLQLMPCLKRVVELAHEASPPGEMLFGSAGRKQVSLLDPVPPAAEASAEESALDADHEQIADVTVTEAETHTSSGHDRRYDVIVIDANDRRAYETLDVFAQTPLSSQRCDPAGLVSAIARWQADLVVLTADELGFDLALALKTQRDADRQHRGAGVVSMMVLDQMNPMTYARAKLAGCTVVMGRPLDPARLVKALRKPLRRLRDSRRAMKPASTSRAAGGFATPWLDTGTGH
ncbi:MAG: hypothetical protein AB8C46_07420 [Burkholderiaceae bacterium]